MCTRQELASYLLTAPPRVALMVEALMQAQGDLQHYEIGVVELHFAHQQVKISLTASLGCYKLDRKLTIP